MRRPASHAWALTLVVGGCVARLDPPPPRASVEFTEGRTLVDLDALARDRARADAAPDELAAQWRAGMAHTRASLEGHVEQRDLAERYLERAWALDPDGTQVPAARVLARFLNMRSSVLDLSKLDLQIRLYQAISAQQRDPARAHEFAGVPASEFHVASFLAAAEALRRYADGHPIAALREIEQLERALQTHTRGNPSDIDSAAMAGNFALTFAGVIPVGVGPRLRDGVAYLEVQQDHWPELSPRARSQTIAPNVHSVFALFLAEGLLARGDTIEAARRYRAIIALTGQPDTAPRRQIVALAEHRLAHLDDYAGARELLPPWPAGVTGCVACHSEHAALPTDDLYWIGGDRP